MSTLLLFEITFDKEMAHQIGAKGSLIFLSLSLLVGFFKFVVDKKIPRVPQKEASSTLKLMAILLTTSVCLALVWAFTGDGSKTEEAENGSEPYEMNDNSFFKVNTSNSNSSGLSPIINSNIYSSSNSNNNINSNNVINSNINSPTNVYQQKYNTTLIQQDKNTVPQPASQGSQSAPMRQGSLSSKAYSQVEQPVIVPRTKENDPELAALAQKLRDLGRRGRREANPDTFYTSGRDVLAAFERWRSECLSIFKRIDHILDERYKEESVSYADFERDIKMPTGILQASDPVTSCKNLYLTFAESLDHYIPKP